MAYFITDECLSCGSCAAQCPAEAIDAQCPAEAIVTG